MRTIKKIITFKQTIFLKHYLNEKICKKLGILLQLKEKLIQLEILVNDSHKYIKDINSLVLEVKELEPNMAQIESNIKAIEKDPTLTDRMNELDEQGKIGNNTTEELKEQEFQESYQKIQQKYIALNSLENRFKNNMKESSFESLKDVFFPEKIKDVRMVKNEYLNS